MGNLNDAMPGSQSMGINQGKGNNTTGDRQAAFLTSEAAARQAANLSQGLSYEISEHNTGGSINFSTRDGQGDGLMGDAPALVTEDYVNALVESLDDTFNSDDWKDALLSTGINCEWREMRTQPTPITKHQLKQRTVHFDSTKRFVDASSAPAGSVGSGKLEAGQAIMMTPVTDGIQFSAVSRIYDTFQMSAGFTTGSLLTAVKLACDDMNEAMCSGIVEVLDKSPSLKTIKTPVLTGSDMAAKADAILDLIAENIRATGFTDHMSDAAIIIPKNLAPCLERLAQRAGYGSGPEALNALIGGTCMTYDTTEATSTKGKIYILPKSLVGLSFRSLKDGSGKQFHVQATRNPSKQAWEIEITGAVDVLAQAWTSVKETTGGATNTVDATIQHLLCLDVGATVTNP
ncbi:MULTISPECIES: hypothetical protein [Enterobacter cloacae complex]|uniref:hypothetical protein n=1 Tax=Enterobacter cloacae complex TaxID=354276 RepID=UPI00345A4A73